MSNRYEEWRTHDVDAQFIRNVIRSQSPETLEHTLSASDRQTVELFLTVVQEKIEQAKARSNWDDVSELSETEARLEQLVVELPRREDLEAAVELGNHVEEGRVHVEERGDDYYLVSDAGIEFKIADRSVEHTPITEIDAGAADVHVGAFHDLETPDGKIIACEGILPHDPDIEVPVE